MLKIDAPKTSVTKTPSSTTTKRQLTQTSKAPVMVTPPVYKLGSVKSTDYYRSMTDLLKDTQEGKDWTKENTNRHSNVLILRLMEVILRRNDRINKGHCE